MSPMMDLVRTLCVFFVAVLVCEARVKGVDPMEERGILLLDAVTFPKIVPHSDFAVMVQVTNDDKIEEYTTEALRADFTNFAQKCHHFGDASNLLFAQVLVKGAQNRKLATSIGVPEEFDRPRLFIFPAGSSTGIPYPMSGSYSDITLFQFASRFTDMHLPIPGIVEAMSPLVKPSMRAGAGEMQEFIEKATAIADAVDENDKENAKYYVHVMKKVQEQGRDFIRSQMTNLAPLLQDDNSIESKTSDPAKKMNILGQFDMLRFSDEL
jgi:hypothetical protein